MNKDKIYKGYFYILTNKRNNVLYAGSTKNLINRLKEHQNSYQKGFTQRYNVNRLIYFETFKDIAMAKAREKEVKGWRREKKIKLIEGNNKQWADLVGELNRDPSLHSG